MGRRRAYGSDIRRFLTAVVAACFVFGAVGVVWGPEIGDALAKTPTTETGWLLIGWLVAGPPLLLAVVVWNDRHRLRPQQRRDLGFWLAAWIGLSMLLVPTVLHGPADYLGHGAAVADPLATGWRWGAAANVVGVLFATLLLVVLHRSVPDRPSERQVALTSRFVEVGWTLALLVSLGLALYAQNHHLFGF